MAHILYSSLTGANMDDSQLVTQNAVIEVLSRIGTCTMEELVLSLPRHEWSEIFWAIEVLGQQSRVSLHHGSDTGYRLALATSAPLSGRSDAKSTPVGFCLGCGFLCDEIDPEDAQSPWIDAHRYLTKYGGRWMELNRLDMLCPACARLSDCAGRGRRLVQT